MNERLQELARDAVYFAAVDPALWADALAAVAAALGAPAAHMGFVDLATGAQSKAEWTGYGDIEAFLSHGARAVLDDPWMVDAGVFIDEARYKARWLVRQGADRIDPAEFRRSAFFNEVARVTDVADYLASVSIIDRRYAAIIAANRLGDGNLFGPAQRAAAESLAPDIDRALRLAHRAAQSAPGIESSLLWERSVLPALFIRETKVAYANPPARSLLERGVLLRGGEAGVSFADGRAQEAFSAVVTRKVRQASVVAEVDNGERWLVQCVGMQPTGSPLSAITAPSTFVLATPLSDDAVGRSEAVAGFAGLTEVERGVLDSLVRGRSVETIAVLFGRSVDTVRWHVRNLIQKTGAASLADLTRIGALLAPF